MGFWFVEVLCFVLNFRWFGDKVKKIFRVFMGICGDSNDIDFYFYMI